MASEAKDQAAGEAAAAEAEAPAAPPPVLHLDVLSTIKEAQARFGLRHNDYLRYRQYCARRAHRLRKSLSLTCGRGKRYEPAPVTLEKVESDRHMMLVLVLAERSWAYGMQLKTETDDDNPRRRFHATRRFAKAALYARQLEAIAAERANDHTQLEVQAYSAFLNGTLHLEREQYNEASACFRTAQTIYTELEKVDASASGDLYRKQLDELVPSMRYCDYCLRGELGDDADTLLAQTASTITNDLLRSRLEKVQQQSLQKHAETMSKVEWRGRSVPIRNDKVRMLIVNATAMQADVKKAGTLEDKMEIYDKLFLALSDAQRELRDERRAKGGDKGGAVLESADNPGVVTSVANLKALEQYLSCMSLELTLQRNLLLADKHRRSLDAVDDKASESKPEDLVRLCDTLVQNMSAIGDLIGDADDARVELNEARTASFKAQRCYYVGRSYAAVNKWDQALALYTHALKLMKDAIQALKDCEEPPADELALLESLVLEARAFKAIAHAQSYASQSDVEETLTELTLSDATPPPPGAPLVDRLDVYAPSTQIAPFPPEFRPSANKPLFFDLASERLELPDLSERKRARRGLFGLW